MTETTKKIFESHEVRKTKEQKKAFEDFVRDVAEKNGYAFSVEEGASKSRNLIVGDVKSAKAVYTAHYDTCSRMPFPNFITPKCVPLFLTYQIGIGFLMALPVLAVTFVLSFLSGFFEARTGEVPFLLSRPMILLISYGLLIGVLLLFYKGPANQHTANDNTSGVTVLLDVMQALPSEERSKIAFIFFDLEEAGLVGSKSFAKRHKAEMEKKLLLNFDCVSDGYNVLFVLRKDAVGYEAYLKQAFQPNETFCVEFASKGVVYPSDQNKFPCGVGVSTLKKKGSLLYMNRIHTARDTVYQEENIEYLKNGAIGLLSILP